jgi:hypothetical protein
MWIPDLVYKCPMMKNYELRHLDRRTQETKGLVAKRVRKPRTKRTLH